MKSLYYTILFLLISTYCFTQNTIDFEYFRRAGKVDVNYYVKNEQSKSKIPVQHEVTLENTSEHQYFIVELSNLRLGLDKNTSEQKQIKDAINYMVHVPIDPSSITLNTESLKFSNITNDGLLAAMSTDKANKKIEIYYEYKNTLAVNSISDLQIKFKVEAIEGYRPLKEEHKGGEIIKCKITVKPNEHYHQQKEIATAENKLFSNYLNASETAYKIKYARDYLSKFPNSNQDRLEDIQVFLSAMASYINPIDHDKKMYKQIIKFCVDEQEKSRCQTLCTQYQDFVWDEPQHYKGTYLERAYLHRIQLFADSPNQEWLSWCEKYIQKFPSSKDSYAVQTLKDEYLQSIEDQKNKSRSPFIQRSTPSYNQADIKELTIDSIDVADIEVEEEILIPQKKDWATILIHDDKSGIIVRTGGLSAEGYVVEFRNVTDQLVEYDPSFVGEKESVELDEVLDGRFKDGHYKISVFSKMDRQLLDTNMIEYNSTKLSPEFTYILLVSFIALGFFSYKKYYKL